LPQKGAYNAKTTLNHQLEASIKLTPMRQIGTVEECVGAYLFLASSEMAGFTCPERG
jgi:hypothetical protein